MKKKLLTNKEKMLWNEAIQKATNEVFLFDGIVINEDDRLFMKHSIRNKLSYKRIKSLKQQ